MDGWAFEKRQRENQWNGALTGGRTEYPRLGAGFSVAKRRGRSPPAASLP